MALETKDAVTLVIATYGAIVATFGVVLPAYREQAEKREAIFRALKGEKEAVAEVASRVIHGDFNRYASRLNSRKKLIRALSMAYVMESSDRAKAYVLSAFEYLSAKNYALDIRSELESICTVLTNYHALTKDSAFKQKRIDPLTALIEHLG